VNALKAALPSVFAVLLMAACAPQEVLVPKSAAVPSGVDLSGRWRLREEQTNVLLGAAEQSAADAEGLRIPSRQGAEVQRPKQDRDSLVHVFLETGSTLKITQTPHGLFVSFDRAVVEEYRFGESRVINVGPVEASRVSGWDDGGYIIETLDEQGNKLVERYRLENGNAVLNRSVQIHRRNQPALSVTQHYDRLP
jgi:hypothetical protein